MANEETLRIEWYRAQKRGPRHAYLVSSAGRDAAREVLCERVKSPPYLAQDGTNDGEDDCPRCDTLRDAIDAARHAAQLARAPETIGDPWRREFHGNWSCGDYWLYFYGPPPEPRDNEARRYDQEVFSVCELGVSIPSGYLVDHVSPDDLLRIGLIALHDHVSLKAAAAGDPRRWLA